MKGNGGDGIGRAAGLTPRIVRCPEALGFEVVERIADIEPAGTPTGGDDGGKALKANAESGGEDEFRGGEEMVFN